MKYNEISSSLEAIFESYKDSFGADDAVYTHIESNTGKKKDGVPPGFDVCRLDYKYCRIETVYMPTPAMCSIRSMLEVRIYLDKRETFIYFSPYELTYNVFSGRRFMWLYPYIESPARMSECAKALFSALSAVIPEIVAFSEDFEKCSLLYDDAKARICTLFKSDIFDCENFDVNTLTLQIAYYMGWRNGFYSSPDFKKMLEGENTRAISGFMRNAKDAELLDFMKLMFKENMDTDIDIIPFSLPEKTDTIGDFAKAHSGKKEFPLFLLATVIFLPLFFIGFCTVYYLLLSIAFKNALYITNSDLSSTLVLLFPALLCSAALSFFSQRTAIKLVSRGEKRERKLAYTELVGSGVKKSMKIFINFVILLSIIFIALFSCRNYAFYTDRFSDNSSLFRLSGTSYYYDDVEKIYTINGINSLVIALKNGNMISTPLDIQISEMKEIFKEHSIPFENVESVSDIPKHQ